MVRLIEKRFILEDIGFVRDNGKLIGMKDIVEVMNNLHEENHRLKKAEILANHRGEMIGFATVLIEELGSKEMRKMWNDFRIIKYKEWRRLD